jgi:hypothetical protein
MKNYQRHSTDMLQFERDRLVFEIEGWEKTLAEVKSALIIRYLNFAIKQAKEKIHAIEAELCYREHN